MVKARAFLGLSLLLLSGTSSASGLSLQVVCSNAEPSSNIKVESSSKGQIASDAASRWVFQPGTISQFVVKLSPSVEGNSYDIAMVRGPSQSWFDQVKLAQYFSNGSQMILSQEQARDAYLSATSGGVTTSVRLTLVDGVWKHADSDQDAFPLTLSLQYGHKKKSLWKKKPEPALASCTFSL